MSRFSNARIGIAGLGLIGGSLAKALRVACPDAVLHGMDSVRGVGLRALHDGTIHHAVDGLPELLRICDVVVLCQPVKALIDSLALAAAAPRLPVLCDVASVKAPVLTTAVRALGARRGRFVGAHPIAGKAERGLQAADADLFQGRPAVLCADGADAGAVAVVRALWQAAGAHCVYMSPAQHDEVYAALSHLPQLLTWAYVRTLAGEPWRAQLHAFAGPGFASFTRLAQSDARLWAEIVHHNRGPVLERLERVRAGLDELRRAVTDGRVDELTAFFDDARGSLGVNPG